MAPFELPIIGKKKKKKLNDVGKTREAREAFVEECVALHQDTLRLAGELDAGGDRWKPVDVAKYPAMHVAAAVGNTTPDQDTVCAVALTRRLKAKLKDSGYLWKASASWAIFVRAWLDDADVSVERLLSTDVPWHCWCRSRPLPRRQLLDPGIGF